MKPFPIYVERARGAHKWDVDGHEYVDYWMGHGALFLGHCHPAVVEGRPGAGRAGHALRRQPRARGALGRAGRKLIPSAEMVRFTMSGTEATLWRCARARLHRADEGREVPGPLPRLARRRGRGGEPALRRADVGRRARVGAGSALVVPAQRHQAGGVALERGDVAAVILEPAGGHRATPTIPGFLQELRSAARGTSVVLIFDEVITGFRYSPGGAQQYFGVTPDLTTLAKIVAGGLPGGAVAGSRSSCR